MGTNFDAITRPANYNMAIRATHTEVRDRSSWYREHLTRVVDAAGAEHDLRPIQGLPGMSTPEQIMDIFCALEHAGMTYAILYFELVYDTSGCAFEREVIPALS